MIDDTSELGIERQRFVQSEIEDGWLHNDQYDYWYDPGAPEVFFSVGRDDGAMLFSEDFFNRLMEDGTATLLFRLIREDHERRSG